MRLTTLCALLSLLFSGAIFGFFYAWICSTMWGLDAADPRVAIRAMQAMNASVRNAVFFPAFFLTPVVLLGTALVMQRARQGAAVPWFAAAGIIYLLGGLVLTAAINVPMNTALADTPVPEDVAAARAIWEGYSPRWQLFNTIRTIASGGALMLAGIGTLRIS